MKLNLNSLLEKYKLEINSIAQFGAHNGQEIEVFLKITKSNIYLFEPQKKAFSKLRVKANNNKQIILFNIGLGSEKSKKNLYVDSQNEGQSASILQPKKHLDIFPKIKFENKEEVNIETFDSFNLKADLICIDVQGAELDSLIGAKHSLKYTKCLVIEVSREEFYKNQPLLKSIDKFLNKNNFIRTKTNWAENGRFLYGDAFYIKRDLISKNQILLNMLKNLILDKKLIANIKFFLYRVKFKLSK